MTMTAYTPHTHTPQASMKAPWQVFMLGGSSEAADDSNAPCHGILKSRLHHSQSVPALTTLHYDPRENQDNDDEMMSDSDGCSKTAGNDEDSKEQQQQQPQKRPQEPKMKRSVSICNLGPQIRHIESRDNLLHIKQDMWFDSKDYRAFASDEINRRRDMGISSMSMLCSSVPAFDDETDDDDEDDDGFFEMEEDECVGASTHGFYF